jgi:hypothetical protein
MACAYESAKPGVYESVNGNIMIQVEPGIISGYNNCNGEMFCSGPNSYKIEMKDGLESGTTTFLFHTEQKPDASFSGTYTLVPHLNRWAGRVFTSTNYCESHTLTFTAYTITLTHQLLKPSEPQTSILTYEDTPTVLRCTYKAKQFDARFGDNLYGYELEFPVDVPELAIFNQTYAYD